jgi:hypothetical protein
MKRRGFLKRLLGAATAAVVSEKLIADDGVALHSIKHPTLLHDAAHHDLAGGFGLAPAKAEGSVMLYDDLDAPLAPDLSEASLEQACIDIKKRSGILTRAEFREQLADGLNKCFEEAYAEYEPDGWPKPG